MWNPEVPIKGDSLITMLERVSLGNAINLLEGQRITVTSLPDQRIAEYEFVRYVGYVQDRMGGKHGFLVKLPSGNLKVLTDVQFGVTGTTAIARFAEPQVLDVHEDSDGNPWWLVDDLTLLENAPSAT